MEDFMDSNIGYGHLVDAKKNHAHEENSYKLFFFQIRLFLKLPHLALLKLFFMVMILDSRKEEIERKR